MLLTRPYPLPEREVGRLSELRRYGVLDTSPEPVLDAAVALARDTFDTKMAAVSLIDDQRLWFKARLGIDTDEMDRSHVFCNYTIMGNETLVVPDTTRDVRFRSNKLVVQSPNIRFYAGHPLKSPKGFNIGAVCILDTEPHPELCARERKQLEHIAHFVIEELNRRLPEGERRDRVRAPAKLDAVVSAYGLKPTAVKIHNISVQGALINFNDHRCIKGDEFIVSIGRTALVATIAWTKEHFVGVRFHRPLTSADIGKFGANIVIERTLFPVWE